MTVSVKLWVNSHGIQAFDDNVLKLWANSHRIQTFIDQNLQGGISGMQVFCDQIVLVGQFTFSIENLGERVYVHMLQSDKL